MKSIPDNIELELFITQAVIDRGIREDGAHCPIAIAATEALRAKGYDLYDIEVENSSFTVVLGGEEYKCYVSQDGKAQIDDFIHDFDNDEDVRPFSRKVVMKITDRFFYKEEE